MVKAAEKALKKLEFSRLTRKERESERAAFLPQDASEMQYVFPREL